MNSGSVVSPGRSSDTLELPSSSELSDEVPLLALSDLPLTPPRSDNASVDGSGSGSGGVPDDCCLRFRYSDIDNYEQIYYLYLSFENFHPH